MQTKLMCAFLAAFLMSACYCPLPDEEDDQTSKGTLTIVWGKSPAARYGFVMPDDLSNLSYEVKLIGPGGERLEKGFHGSEGFDGLTFRVIPGTWTVTLKGHQWDPVVYRYDLRVMGIKQVEVKAGRKTAETIDMYTATEVESWSDLYYAIQDNGYFFDDPDYLLGGKVREEIYVIKKSFETDWEDAISISQPIIIIAEDDVTISRGYNGGTGYLFYIRDNGKLTLGIKGMAGTLTFEGDAVRGTTSLIMVGNEEYFEENSSIEPGTLIMNDGVCLQNNTAFYYGGSGVHVTYAGTFIMYGGKITGNTTEYNGGGVFVNYTGTFNQTGGSVTGNPGSNVVYFADIAEKLELESELH
jgi:hypothetical protein